MKPFEDLHSGVGSPSHAVTIELQRASTVNKVTPVGTNQFVTPGNSGMKNLSHMFYVSHLFGDVLRLSYEINYADTVYQLSFILQEMLEYTLAARYLEMESPQLT